MDPPASQPDNGDSSKLPWYKQRHWWEWAAVVVATVVETVIYDNGMDQEIGGGNIVVHTTRK